MDSTALISVASSLLTRLPLLIVYGVAIGYAVVRWDKHPQVSLLVVLAVAGLTLQLVVGTFVSTWVPMRLRAAGRTTSDLAAFYSLYGVVSGVLSAGFWGMVVAALFGWRPSQVERPS
jgi:uncharacterized membrane protein YfcA